LHHAIDSSVFGIGQIIAYLVHYHMVVFCYVNAVVDFSNNVNDIWETWKYIVNTAAESVARKVHKVKNYKNFWDEGLDKILKRRREANRLQRLHNKKQFPIGVISKLPKMFNTRIAVLLF
jgi:hypothetical protein